MHVSAHGRPQQSTASCDVITSQPSLWTMLQFAKLPVHDITVHAPPEHPAVPCVNDAVLQSTEHVGPHALTFCVASQPLPVMPSALHALPAHAPIMQVPALHVPVALGNIVVQSKHAVPQWRLS
jgi:hypothetical protein